MAPAVCGLVACIQDLSLKDRWPVFKTVDLVESAASVSVRGFVAHLSIDLTYENGFNQPVEVTYTCPVDARAAIYHFEAQLDGRTITGQCLERNKAEKIYKDAVEQGHTAIIAAEDKCSSDVLHLSLGNLGKGERAKLQVKMVQELSVGIDGSVTFTLPTVFNPRYSPADFVEFGNQPVHSFGGPVVQTQNQLYAMKVDAEVVGSNKIDKISSQSDQINFSLGDDDTTAKISHMGDFKCDHDFGFQIHYRSPYHPHVLRESGDRSSTGMMTDDIIMVNFFPEFPVEAYSPHNEIIFLVDRSGSMQGERIQSSKSALLLFLKSLPQGCRFNIISFGSTYSALFPSGSERYTESTLKTALDLQKSMDADMGGTEIFQALKFIYSNAPVPGYARKILVLTDGEVWNVNEIMELVERQSDEAQVFSVGIGDGASTALIHGLARAGRGRYEMVMDTNILQMKVMGLVASMLQDNVSDLSIKFEVDPPQKVTLIPNLPPIIFGGQHLIIYGRVAPNSELKSIVLSGKLKENTLTVAVEDKDCKTVHDGRLSIHRIAAKSQISSWQVNCTEGIQDEMVALSVASGVVCRKTAIVGVDTEGKVFKEKENVNSGVNYRIGGGGGDGGSSSAFMKRFLKKGSAGNLSSPFKRIPREQNQSRSADVSNFRTRCLMRSNITTTRGDATGVVEPQDELIEIVSSQNFDGSWSLESCWKVLNVPVDKKQILTSIQIEFKLDDVSFATVLCLTLLNVRFPTRKQEWNMIAIKGNSFLRSKGHNDGSKIIEKLTEIINQVTAR